MTTSSGNEQEAAIRMDAAISEAVAKGRQQLADELKKEINGIRGSAVCGVEINADHDPAVSHGFTFYIKACDSIIRLIDGAIQGEKTAQAVEADGRQQLADDLKNAVEVLHSCAQRGVELNAEHDPAASYGHAGYTRACARFLLLIDDAIKGNKLPEQWRPSSERPECK